VVEGDLCVEQLELESVDDEFLGGLDDFGLDAAMGQMMLSRARW
jgi:hypothetical protein